MNENEIKEVLKIRMNQTNFWEDLKKIDFTNKQNLDNYLLEQWGTPLDNLQNSLLSEISKKIHSYYSDIDSQKTNTIYSFIGTIESVNDIVEKEFKEGKRKEMFKTFFALKMENEWFQASKEYLTPEKWQQIEKFAILGQKLVFKYKKWLKNKHILDFYPYENNEVNKINDNEKNT